jgi:hypothetical protein
VSDGLLHPHNSTPYVNLFPTKSFDFFVYQPIQFLQFGFYAEPRFVCKRYFRYKRMCHPNKWRYAVLMANYSEPKSQSNEKPLYNEKFKFNNKVHVVFYW